VTLEFVWEMSADLVQVNLLSTSIWLAINLVQSRRAPGLGSPPGMNSLRTTLKKLDFWHVLLR